MTKSVEINQIGKEIVKNLEVYAADVKKEINKAINQTTKEIKKEIEAKSPEKTGSYKSGWRIKKVDEFTKVVHNKTDYQLTHLLEHPHPLKNGQKSRGFPHIAPAEQKGVKNYLKRIEKAVKP